MKPNTSIGYATANPHTTNNQVDRIIRESKSRGLAQLKRENKLSVRTWDKTQRDRSRVLGFTPSSTQYLLLKRIEK